MKYKCNLDKVWNLPRATSELYTPSTGGYCAVGKITAGCGISIESDGSIGDQDFADDFSRTIRAAGYNSVYSYGMVENDDPIFSAKTEQDKQLAHEKACRKLLEICLKHGLIELEDSDLEIVRELKKVSQGVPINA